MYNLKIREQILELLPENWIGCELGVFKGDFSKILASSPKMKELYLVDLFSAGIIIGSGDKNGNNSQNIDGQELFDLNKKQFSDRQNIHVIRGSSLDFLDSQPNNSLDFIYIDSGHTYELTKSELRKSLEKISSRGIIAGHDYDANRYVGIYNAVNEFAKEFNLNFITTEEDGLASFFFINPIK